MNINRTYFQDENYYTTMILRYVVRGNPVIFGYDVISICAIRNHSSASDPP